MKRFHSLLLGTALGASVAHAGLPLLTEDAGVLAPRGCELEAGALSQRADGDTALEHEGFALGSPPLAPMVELFGNDREAPWWNAGLRLTLVPEQLSLGLSCGQQIHRERTRLAIASLKLAF